MVFPLIMLAVAGAGLAVGLGGGGNSDVVNRSINETVNETVSRTVNNNTSKCKNITDNKQVIDLEFDVKGCRSVNIGNMTQSIVSTSDLECRSDNINSKTITTDLKRELDNDLETTRGFMDAFGSSGTTNEIINTMKNKLTDETTNTTLQECINESINDQKNTQKITIECPVLPIYGKDRVPIGYANTNFDYKDVSQSIVSNAISTCIYKNENIQDVLTSIEEHNKNASKITKKGIEGLSDSLSSFMIILIVGLLVVFTMFTGGGKGSMIMLIVVGLIVFALFGGLALFSGSDDEDSDEELLDWNSFTPPEAPEAPQ